MALDHGQEAVRCTKHGPMDGFSVDVTQKLCAVEDCMLFACVGRPGVRVTAVTHCGRHGEGMVDPWAAGTRKHQLKTSHGFVSCVLPGCTRTAMCGTKESGKATYCFDDGIVRGLGFPF